MIVCITCGSAHGALRKVQLFDAAYAGLLQSAGTHGMCSTAACYDMVCSLVSLDSVVAECHKQCLLSSGHAVAGPHRCLHQALGARAGRPVISLHPHALDGTCCRAGGCRSGAWTDVPTQVHASDWSDPCTVYGMLMVAECCMALVAGGQGVFRFLCLLLLSGRPSASCCGGFPAAGYTLAFQGVTAGMGSLCIKQPGCACPCCACQVYYTCPACICAPNTADQQA